MRKYLRILNQTIIVFVLLFTVLTIVDIHEIKYQTEFNYENIKNHISEMAKEAHSIIQDENHGKVYNYIIEKLESFGFVNEDSNSKPAYLIQTSYVSSSFDTRNDLYNTLYGSRFNYQDKIGLINEPYKIDNIIVSIPANSISKSNEAIMFMSHYDSVPTGPGASDDIVATSVLLEAINYYLDKMDRGFKIDNDLVFVFTDGEEFGMYGADLFAGANRTKDTFNGFNNLINRIKFAVNLESRGTDGTLIMFETSSNNYQTIKLFSKINDNVFTSSIANKVYQSMPNGTDFSSYNEIYQGLNFANLGAGFNYHTQNDNISNVKSTYLTQQANLVYNVVEEVSNYDLDNLYTAKNDAIYFSYLNIGVFYYSKTFSYFLAGLAIVLIAFLIGLSIINKRKNLLKTIKGYLIIFASVIVSMIISFILYYFYTFTASIFGVIDNFAIGKVFYSNIPIVIGLIVISITVTAIVTLIMSRLLNLNGKDVRRSVAYFISFIGIILTFVFDIASYLFIIIGIFLLIIELISLLSKDNDIEKLHLNLFVFGLSLPIFIPVIFLASDALGIQMAFALSALISIFSLSFIPLHLESFKIFTISKLRNIIIHENKYTEKPIYGMLSIILISMLSLLVLTSIKTNISVNHLGINLPYDDALVYVIDNNKSKFMVKDIDAYPYLKNSLENYYFDPSLRGYIKEDNNPTFTLAGLSHIDLNDNVITINRNNLNGYVEICFEQNSNVKSIDINVDGRIEHHKLDLQNKLYTIRIRHDATVVLNTENNEEVYAKIKCIELLINYEPLKTYGDFKNIVEIEQAKYNLINVTNLK